MDRLIVVVHHAALDCMGVVHQVVLLDCFLLSPQFESCPNSSSPDRSRQSQGDSIVTAQQPRINQDHPMARGKLFLPKIAESDPPPTKRGSPSSDTRKAYFAPNRSQGDHQSIRLEETTCSCAWLLPTILTTQHTPACKDPTLARTQP